MKLIDVRCQSYHVPMRRVKHHKEITAGNSIVLTTIQDRSLEKVRTINPYLPRLTQFFTVPNLSPVHNDAGRPNSDTFLDFSFLTLLYCPIRFIAILNIRENFSRDLHLRRILSVVQAEAAEIPTAIFLCRHETVQTTLLHLPTAQKSLIFPTGMSSIMKH